MTISTGDTEKIHTFTFISGSIFCDDTDRCKQYCLFSPVFPRRLFSTTSLFYSPISTMDFEIQYRQCMIIQGRNFSVFAENVPLSLPSKAMFLKKHIFNNTCRDSSERIDRDSYIKTINCPPDRPPYRNQSDLEGRRACVRARPRQSNKERKWPLLACHRFFLVSYASFIIICFDASLLDVVSCSLCLFNPLSCILAYTNRVYTFFSFNFNIFTWVLACAHIRS